MAKSKKSQKLKISKLSVEPGVAHGVLKTLKKAEKFHRKTKRIHGRRIIPVVPEGSEVANLSPTRPLALEVPGRRRRRMSAAMMDAAQPSDQLVLVRNVELTSLADNNTASPICEPSVAENDEVVFYTGNWFAALSKNGGNTFRFVDPNNAFPDPPGMRFCCDQVVQYIKKIDTFVWLLQYTQNQAGGNIQRIAYATTEEVRNGNWNTFDISPQSIGQPASLFLDFPDLALGSNNLYMTTNGFLGQGWEVTILIRIPFSTFTTGNVTGNVVTSSANFNFRVAQHCGTTAFWASHEDSSTLRVFSWKESSNRPTSRTVSIPRWVGGNGYTSITPGGRNWLARSDPRILGAAKSGSHVWFAWGVDKGGASNLPNPYIQVAKINTSNFDVDTINVWDPLLATAYPGLSVNSSNEVGISYMLGGRTKFPSNVVGILTRTRRDVIAVEGKRGPNGREWGDYLTVRRTYPNDKLFCATGYTLQDGVGNNDASPHYMVFGREADIS